MVESAPGVRRPLVTAAWSVLALGAAALFAVGLVAEAGRSGQIGLIALTGATWWVAGVAVAFRGRGAPGPLLTASFLVAFGTAGIHGTDQLLAPDPLWGPVVAVLQFVGAALLAVFLFTFPDGRCGPRWTWVAVLTWTLIEVDAYLLDWLPLPPGGGTVGAALAAALLVGGFLAQRTRYRQADDETRRQTRVVLLGTGAATLGIAALIVPALVEPRLWLPDSPYRPLLAVGVTGLFLLVPVSIALATWRHRLWDLEPVVAGFTVYAALSLVVVTAYTAVVAGLGQVLGADGAAPVAAAVVAVGALPIRGLLQRRVTRLVYGQRDEPYAVLSELGRRLEEPAAGLQVVVETVCSALRVPAARIVLGRPPDTRTVASTGTAPGTPARWPLGPPGEPLGELLVHPRSPGRPLGPRDRRLLEDLSRRAGAAATAVTLTEDLRRSRRRLVQMREEERRRLRRDLHDGLASRLAGLGMQAGALARLVRRDPATVESVLAEHAAELQAAVGAIRELVHGLRPPNLDELGFVAALDGLAARTDLPVTVDVPDPLPSLPAAVESAVYWITSEALTNAVRHAGATSVRVRVTAPGELVVTVQDDGVGIAERRTAGVGLASMRERAAELGGRCEVGRLARGTEVVVHLPLDPP